MKKYIVTITAKYPKVIRQFSPTSLQFTLEFETLKQAVEFEENRLEEIYKMRLGFREVKSRIIPNPDWIQIIESYLEKKGYAVAK
jgi:hypothetical protein